MVVFRFFCGISLLDNLLIASLINFDAGEKTAIFAPRKKSVK